MSVFFKKWSLIFGRAESTEGDAIPELAVLNFMKKQAKKIYNEQTNKQYISMATASTCLHVSTLLEFLS